MSYRGAFAPKNWACVGQKILSDGYVYQFEYNQEAVDKKGSWHAFPGMQCCFLAFGMHAHVCTVHANSMIHNISPDHDFMDIFQIILIFW